ncbi:MAG: hypothetical protein R3F60_10545 [bacterium]
MGGAGGVGGAAAWAARAAWSASPAFRDRPPRRRLRAGDDPLFATVEGVAFFGRYDRLPAPALIDAVAGDRAR